GGWKERFEFGVVNPPVADVEQCDHFVGHPVEQHQIVNSVAINVHGVELCGVHAPHPGEIKILSGGVLYGNALIQRVRELCRSEERHQQQEGGKVKTHHKFFPILNNDCQRYPVILPAYFSGDRHRINMAKLMEIRELYEKYTDAKGVSTDTRQVAPGWLFFALKGEKFDANAFAAEAWATGAGFVVMDGAQCKPAERCILVPDVLSALQQRARYHRDQLNLPVVA